VQDQDQTKHIGDDSIVVTGIHAYRNTRYASAGKRTVLVQFKSNDQRPCVIRQYDS